ncbi:MAG TPA: hypothetical protein VFX15_13125, partial [Actinomycetes bacterium]|nr:hypothetical protein [Actinomycetes bacterium]
TYLELIGTWLGIWSWATHDPTGLVSMGNPPTGAAGGYGWFDLVAISLAPVMVRWWRRTTRSPSSTTEEVEELAV